MKTLSFWLLGLLILWTQSTAFAAASSDDQVERFQLDFYGGAGLNTSFEDSLQARWSYSLLGGQAWVSSGQNKVFSFKAEGQIAYGDQAEAFLSEAFVQHDWRNSNGNFSLRAGQYRNLALESFPQAYEATLLRPNDAELPFTGSISGAALQVAWYDQLGGRPFGASAALGYGARRTWPARGLDSLFSAFPMLDSDVWVGNYHLNGYWSIFDLHLSWEEEIGHNVSLYTRPWQSLALAGGWSYRFHPDGWIAPDNLYVLKGNWDFLRLGAKQKFFLTSGFDFGEQAEAWQAFLGWKNSGELIGSLSFQVGYDSRLEQAVAAVRYYWRP
ncbi:hypothetical protein H6761_01720 [Candidatus Nomurabacteria bacterium]|nr:hypothetical protein [Candidatus Nomurabacteria bacterium]